MTTPTPLTGIEAMTVMYQEEYELRVQKEKELAAALDLQAAYFARCEQLCDALAAAQERAQAAEARAEAAEKDAGRYRWLRVQPHADIAACWYIPVLPQDYPVDTPEQRDAAIDAAREGK